MARENSKSKQEDIQRVKDLEDKRYISRYKHRQGALWLTSEICQEYRQRALEIDRNEYRDIGERRKLRIELQEKCDILEIEALNIINGLYHDECVKKYIRVKKVLNGHSLLDPNSPCENYLREMDNERKKEYFDEFSIPDEIDT